MTRTLAALLISALGCISAQGCAPETRTRIEDRPDTAPMELPEWGWTISFVKTVNDGEPMEPAELDCTVIVNESGGAADYCGFPVWVSQDAFSFDSRPYRALAFYYGPIIVDIDGAGDADGAVIEIRADYADSETWEPFGLAYTVRYVIEHIGEIE